MKKCVLFVVLSFVMSLTSLAQFGVGLRDTRYVNVNYTFKNRMGIELEHSVFSEKFKYQHVRLSGFYSLPVKNFEFQVKPYFGTLYCGDYYDLGAFVNARYRVLKPLVLCGTFNPHYDSGFEYKTCFMLGAECNVYKDLSVVAQYTTIPEYRQSEKRIRGGLKFDVEHLWVQPMISIPVESGKTKSVRVSVSMGYQFK